MSIGALGMLVGAVSFAYLGTQAPQGTRHFYAITFVIALIAFLSYLVMATGGGATLVGDRVFYYARYVDWVFTTPLLLLDLALLALARPGRNVGLIVGIIVLDLFMILTGLWAGATEGAGRYFLWFISTAAMVALLYLVVTRLFAAARTQSPGVQQVFRTLAILTVVLWSLYPIVWLLGTEGFGTVGITTEVALFLVLDLSAKIGFGFLLLTNRQALGEISSGGAARPARVS
ncbi:bacteriorhodopsin [Rubrobacter marinus]|uniref:bacteriorhodopsin n=1 Tax=Rubrobacter marinus TaxID=2653852 RepID=UPI001A9E364E|nr:bacteriorhodopsin [Rubrobacter marinus]